MKDLGAQHECWLALERQNAEQVIELWPEQAAFLEKPNACFKERHIESGRPGELLLILPGQHRPEASPLDYPGRPQTTSSTPNGQTEPACARE
jgi:hypothetical protein